MGGTWGFRRRIVMHGIRIVIQTLLKIGLYVIPISNGSI